MTRETMKQRIDRVAEELRQRQATAYERVRCPTCGAPTGVRCRSMPRGYRILDGQAGRERVLRSSHKARLRADGIPLR